MTLCISIQNFINNTKHLIQHISNYISINYQKFNTNDITNNIINILEYLIIKIQPYLLKIKSYIQPYSIKIIPYITPMFRYINPIITQLLYIKNNHIQYIPIFGNIIINIMNKFELIYEKINNNNNNDLNMTKSPIMTVDYSEVYSYNSLVKDEVFLYIYNLYFSIYIYIYNIAYI